MEMIFCQLVFVLWVLPFGWTDQVTMSSASRDPPKNESTKSTLAESGASVTMGLDNMDHPTASERENFTTLSSMGNGPAPPTWPTAPVKKLTAANDLSVSAEGVPHHLGTSMTASLKRITRNTGPVQGELNTTLQSDPEVQNETGILKMSVSPTDQPDPKVSLGAPENSTPLSLAQTSLEEQSNITPAQQLLQSEVTSSAGPLTVQHTTAAKPAGPQTNMPTTATNQETIAHSSQPPPTESTPTSVSLSQNHSTSTHKGSTQPAPEVKTSTSPTSIITTSKHTLPPNSTRVATPTTSTASVTVSQTPMTTGKPAPTPTPKEPSEPPTTTSTTTRRRPPRPKPPEQEKSGAGRAVGIIVGLTLILMLLGIAFILLRKRRTQRRQLNDPTWAGPSPFLDGGAQPQLPGSDDEGGDLLKDSKRISLVGILPRRLSKRLSLLKESDEEVLMGEIPSGSTFGRVQEDEVKSSNGSLPEQGQNKNQNQNPDKDNTNGGAVEGSMAPAAPAPLEDISLGPPPAEVVTTPPPPKLDEQHPAPPLVLLDVDLGPSAGETAVPPPPPCEDSFVAPPAPPLPSSVS